MNNGTIAVSNQVSFGRADDRGFSVYRDPPTARERRTGNGARPDDPPPPDGQQTPDDDKRRKQADVLIELAEPAKLFHTADATGWNFARMPCVTPSRNCASNRFGVIIGHFHTIPLKDDPRSATCSTRAPQA